MLWIRAAESPLECEAGVRRSTRIAGEMVNSPLFGRSTRQWTGVFASAHVVS